MELPDHLISDIFSWLPAKSLCKFKCCSKSISRLTRDKYFAIKHSQNSSLKDDSSFLIQSHVFEDGRTEIHGLPSSSSSSSYGIPKSFLHFLSDYSVRIIASSNGLLLCEFFSTPIQLIVCNPTTQFFAHIPFPIYETIYPNGNEPYFQFAFECNNSDGKYKIFAFEDEGKESPPSNFGFRIYDSEKGVWEIRENHLVVPGKAIEGLDFRFPVFHKGAIHFLSCDPHGPYILAYNVESGISTTLNLPQECRETEFKARIFKWGKAGRSNYDDDDDESICLVRFDGEKKSFGIWVLMDYETSFWSKLLEISFEEMELGSEDFSVSGYSVMNGNSLVFGTKKNVFWYDLTGQRKTRLERICSRSRFKWKYLCFFPYSSTFCSCGIGEAQIYLTEGVINFPDFLRSFYVCLDWRLRRGRRRGGRERELQHLFFV